MSLENLSDLFHHELRDTLDAEKQILKALPKMIKAASSEDLKAAFEEHLEVTETHVKRLEKVFSQIDKTARGKKCLAMAGIVEESGELMKEDADEQVMDAALIAAAQKVEHYEIATYGTLVAWAKQLGLEDAAALLEETLAEENEADDKLTELAAEINAEAQDVGDE
jgi:ferritin-like metal-binding protein YciE